MVLEKFFKKKCPVCSAKVDALKTEIRLKAGDGSHSVFVCDNCANFFEDSAEVLKRKKQDDDSV